MHDVGGNLVCIDIPISIVGESRKYCIVMGGLWMRGKTEDDVNVSNLTLRKSKPSIILVTLDDSNPASTTIAVVFPAANAAKIGCGINIQLCICNFSKVQAIEWLC